MTYQLLALTAFIVAAVLTRASIPLLRRYGWMDRVEKHSTHRISTPRGGGIAVYLTFVVLVLLMVPIEKHLIGLIAGGSIVFLVNFIDDRIGVSPVTRLAFEILGCLIVIVSGIGIVHITNPFSGEAISLDMWRIPVTISGVTHYIVPLADIFAVIWILVLTNAMNWLDGLDGLATGVGAIGSLTVFGLSLLPFVNQPDMATMALILGSACVGFLIYNFSPAKIKLGDAGSTFIGFTLAVMAIYSSGKIATFFLVLGLPLLDVAWVLFRRLFLDRTSPFRGDQGHFHHRLLRAGFSVRQIVVIVYLFCASFGIIALTLHGAQKKLLAITIMALVMGVFGVWVVWRSRKA